jgi:hypothetical protein
MYKATSAISTLKNGIASSPSPIKVNFEIWVLLEYYAASSSNPLPTFRDNVLVQSSRVKTSFLKNFLTFEYGTDTLSWNICEGLPLRNIPEERTSHQDRGGSLKSRKLVFFSENTSCGNTKEDKMKNHHHEICESAGQYHVLEWRLCVSEMSRNIRLYSPVFCSCTSWPTYIPFYHTTVSTVPTIHKRTYNI